MTVNRINPSNCRSARSRKAVSKAAISLSLTLLLAGAGAPSLAVPPSSGPVAVSRGRIAQGPWLLCADQQGMIHILYRNRPFIHGFGVFSGLNGYTTPQDLEMTDYSRGDGTVTFKGRVRGKDIAFEQTAAIEGNRVKLTIRRTGAWPSGTWGGIQIPLLQSFFTSKKYRTDVGEAVFPEKYDPGRLFPSGFKRIELDPSEPGMNLIVECADGMGIDDQRKFDSPRYILNLPLPRNESDPLVIYITFPDPKLSTGWDLGNVRWSRIGYPLAGEKTAILEWPRNAARPGDAVRVEDSSGRTVREGRFGTTTAVDWLQDNFAEFDFSDLRVPGEFRIAWSGGKTGFFRVATNVFLPGLWEPTLDFFIPFEMCHAAVDLGTNILGHGLCHDDDAERVPARHTGPDGFISYECADTPFKAGEHVPLNTGGWHDAGDFDLNTPAQSFVVWTLSLTWEEFRPGRDVATLDPKAKIFKAGTADGTPDLIQQIGWGALWLLSVQQKNGRVWNGVCEKPAQRSGKPLETITDGRPGNSDDRQLYPDYHADQQLNHVIAMAAAGRALKGFDSELSKRCVESAKKGFRYFLTHKEIYRPGSYTAVAVHEGERDAGVMAAAIELYLTTRDPRLMKLIRELSWSLPGLKLDDPLPRGTGTGGFRFVPPFVARLVPLLGPNEDEDFRKRLTNLCHKAAWLLASKLNQRPWPLNEWDFGMWGNTPIGLSRVFDAYWLRKVSPRPLDPTRLLRSILWIYGLHPTCDTVLVSGLGYPETRWLYNIHLQAVKGFGPGNIPGAVIPGMGGFWYSGVAAYVDEYGYYGHNEACIYTQAQYLFAINAMDAMGF